MENKELDVNKNPKKVAILMESDFYEKEIEYYQKRFPDEGVETHFMSRLWGQPTLVFNGHEEKLPFTCEESFEDVDDQELDSYSAVIIPAGYVSDRLRYTEDIRKLPPAAEFMKRVFSRTHIIKGIICHGLWLLAPVPELIRGRKLVVHNNLLGDAKNMGAVYVDQDIVEDGDLVTARSGDHHQLFVETLLKHMGA